MKLSHLLLIAIILVSGCRPRPGTGVGDPGNVNNGSCTANQALTVKNKPYSTGNRQKVNMFLPANRTCNTPAVLLLTGGIWSYSSKDCDKNSFVNRMKTEFKNRGYAVLTMDYRYATGNPYDQINDVKQCIDSLMVWSNRYVFSDRIHVIGESSGAYLAMMYALQYRNPKTPSVVAISPGMDFADTTVINAASSLHIIRVSDPLCGFWIYPSPTSELTLFDLGADFVGTEHYPNHDMAELGNPCINILPNIRNYPLSCGVTPYANAKLPDVLIIHGTLDQMVPGEQARTADSLFATNPIFTHNHKLVFLPFEHGYLGSTVAVQARIDSVTAQWVEAY